MSVALNSIIPTQKYSQNENTITGKNYEKYPTTNSYLGWARIFKTGRLPNFITMVYSKILPFKGLSTWVNSLLLPLDFFHFFETLERPRFI
jgi:hypothetical protein